jgi:methionyl-tRNA synthetase
MANMDIRKATSELRAIWVAGNEYLQVTEPWAKFKTDPEAAAVIVRFALNLVALYADISEPFIPDAAETMRDAMNSDKGWPTDVTASLSALSAGHAFSVPDVMFAKISDDQTVEMQERFAGS